MVLGIITEDSEDSEKGSEDARVTLTRGEEFHHLAEYRRIKPPRSPA
jgi:hypothetical protein